MSQKLPSQSTATIGLAVGKRINPLPPIEQYKLYQSTQQNTGTSNFAASYSQLPIKKQRNNRASMQSGFSHQSDRDAMVNDIFSNKKQMRNK